MTKHVNEAVRFDKLIALECSDADQHWPSRSRAPSSELFRTSYYLYMLSLIPFKLWNIHGTVIHAHNPYTAIDPVDNVMLVIVCETFEDCAHYNLLGATMVMGDFWIRLAPNGSTNGARFQWNRGQAILWQLNVLCILTISSLGVRRTRRTRTHSTEDTFLPKTFRT